MVVGGLVGATASLLLPAPGPLAATLALVAATVAGGLYAALAAWGQIRFAIPMLISSLLLSYTAVGIVSYLVRFPLARHDDRPAADRARPCRREAADAGRAGQRRHARHRGGRGARHRDRSPRGDRLRTQDARPQRAVRRLWRRAARSAGAGRDVRERRHRRPGRRDRRARRTIPLHRRRAADARLHLVGPDGGAARGRRAGRGDSRGLVLRGVADRRVRDATGDLRAARADAWCCKRSSSSSSRCGMGSGNDRLERLSHALPDAIGGPGDHANSARLARRRSLRARRRLQHGARGADADRRVRGGRRQLFLAQRLRSECSRRSQRRSRSR